MFDLERASNLIQSTRIYFHQQLRPATAKQTVFALCVISVDLLRSFN